MRLSITFALITICVAAMGQSSTPEEKSSFRVEVLVPDIGSRTPDPSTRILSKIKYTDPSEKAVTIENSGTRGGSGFTDTIGNRFGYRVFWTRITNESSTPLELIISFPADSFPLSSPDSYMKVFLPPDTMRHDERELTLYDARLKSAYDAVPHTPPKLQRTIKPKEAYSFYIVVLRHHKGSIGSPGAGFALQGHDLFYRISPEFHNALIPCGQVVFKE